MTYEEIWDKFTDLHDEQMVDIAERALEGKLYIFKVQGFNEGFKRASAWCRLDLNSDCFDIFVDIMDLLTDYEDEILDGIATDEELMWEVCGTNIEDE